MLRTTVNSFDIFDTLLARHCITPTGIAEELERKFNARGFAVARRAMEFQLAQQRGAFELHDIYDALVAAATLTRADADRLLEAEIEAEFENAIPIVENLKRVREGDLVVSDMYLPVDTLRRLLLHVGLRVPVRLYASNLGKHHGWIWEDLCARWIVNRHYGDNPHSDVAIPRQHGIEAVHYAGAAPTAIEQATAAHGFPALAQLMRSLRLRNPYDSGSQSAELWNLSAQLNTPFLVLGSALARQRRDAAGVRKILFSARDCYLMSEIFSVLYPAEHAEYLYVSRETLAADSPAVRDYLLRCGLQDALVCDIAATGASWCQFTAKEQIRARLFSFVFIDNWALARVSSEKVTLSPWLEFSWALKTSELSIYSTAIEVINAAPHPSCSRISSAGRFFVPEFHSSNELPDALLQPIIQHHTLALELLRKVRGAVLPELARPIPVELLATLVESMSRSDLLNSFGKLLRWPSNLGPMTN